MEFPLAQFLTTSSVFYTLQVRAYIKKKKKQIPCDYSTRSQVFRHLGVADVLVWMQEAVVLFVRIFFFIPSGSSFFSPGLFSSNRRVFF